MMMKDQIYKIAFEGAKMSHLVNVISDSYVDVSNKHIMHRIAGNVRNIDFILYFGQMKT